LLAFFLHLLLEGFQPGVPFFQVLDELFFLGFLGEPALLQTMLQLHQANLLGRHGCRLNAKAFLAGPDRKQLSCPWGQTDFKLERPQGQNIAVVQQTIIDRLAVDEDLPLGGQIAENGPDRTGDEGNMKGSDFLQIQAHVTDGVTAKQRQWAGNGATVPLLPSIQND
jgi:hypothetical protein